MKEDIKNLFISELQEIFDAEKQIVEALPEMVRNTDSPELKDAFNTHLQETKDQVLRLQQIFTQLGINSGTKSCKAMKGLIQECQDIIESFPMSLVRDAALISKIQRIELYEVSAYGTLRTFAKELELDEIADLLQETLDEEAAMDKKLTKIAEGGLLTAGINQRAMS